MDDDLFSDTSEVEPKAPFVAPSGRNTIGEARFIVTEVGSTYEVTINAPLALSRGVGAQWFEGRAPNPKIALRIDLGAGTLSIFPQVMYFSQYLYEQKYRQITEIQVDLEGQYEAIDGHDDVVEVLRLLSSGFIKDPAYGLGVVMEMRPLIKAIEEVKGVTRLVIGAFETTRIEHNTFYMDADEFRAIRSGMSRIASHHQKESLSERELMAHNSTIHRVLPNEYPYKEQAYKAGTVFKLLGGNSAVKLRGQDRVGVLKAIADNASEIADRDPKEFVQLQKDIEIVGLDRLIASVGRHIKRNSAEAKWQELLELNPFLLSMLFGQPVVILRPSANVGGATVAGDGSKIADFLMSNPLSQNAALVELKTPKASLLGAKDYRTNVYPPHREIMGAVVQILDQRLKLLTNIGQLKLADKRKRIADLEVSSVDCVIVAGRSPTDPYEISSFELIRTQFKDVRIITFDELLERVQLLRVLLSGERYVSDVEDDPYDFGDDFNVDDEIELGAYGHEPDPEDSDPRD